MVLHASTLRGSDVNKSAHAHGNRNSILRHQGQHHHQSLPLPPNAEPHRQHLQHRHSQCNEPSKTSSNISSRHTQSATRTRERDKSQSQAKQRSEERQVHSSSRPQLYRVASIVQCSPPPPPPPQRLHLLPSHQGHDLPPSLNRRAEKHHSRRRSGPPTHHAPSCHSPFPPTMQRRKHPSSTIDSHYKEMHPEN